MTRKTCRWHECGKEFAPTDPRQEFCTPVCQRRRGSWKAKRGAPLVDMLLNGDAKGLMLAKVKMLKEMHHGS